VTFLEMLHFVHHPGTNKGKERFPQVVHLEVVVELEVL